MSKSDPARNFDEYLERIRNLNVNKSGERRSPHQPLLLLFSIGRLLKEQRQISFSEVEETLRPLLNAYAPPAKRHQPELPFWHLRNSFLWEVTGAEEFPLQKGGFPKMASLRTSIGQLEKQFADLLLRDAGRLTRVVNSILEENFPESLHEEILAAVGLEVPDQESSKKIRRRDHRFRQEVLRAYEHRCAVTGFRVALAGQYFGCEAAHVRWHAYNGPDTVKNGFAVEPTLHKLFDAGAWTFSDERLILVSKELTGSDETIQRLRNLHGQPIRKPIQVEDEISVEFIQWHRKPELGGVFRHPPLT